MLCLSYYFLSLHFDGAGEKLRTGYAWKGGGGGEKGGGGGMEGEMTPTMYAHMNI
jgi:hypothetical protein